MEALLAIAIGVLAGAGVWLLLRAQVFPVLIGLTLLSYAVNLLILASGRLTLDASPIVEAGRVVHPDPLPQALVLTAIVIGFAMTAVLVALALRAYGADGSEDVDGNAASRDDRPNATEPAGEAPRAAHREPRA
jgi:multicomponent K+:H+ antiporter subunit C